MGQPGRDGSVSLASTPSEDLASGDPMGMNKTGTLGPADKDRRSKKKSVSGTDVLFYFVLILMTFHNKSPK
ncbi:hypothetical protein INR49_030521 [Caranx melampygus]|nr:hypothetical protein INR49_030521 [Caranx melampygus]